MSRSFARTRNGLSTIPVEKRLGMLQIALLVVGALSAAALVLAIVLGLSADPDVDTNSRELEELQNQTIVVMGSKIVYVDALDGLDTNNGSLEAPVQTIPTALGLFSEVFADECIIRLAFNQSFDLGEDPTLNFHSVVRNCAVFVIEGAETELHSDTVTDVGISDPTGRRFNNLTVSSGAVTEDYTSKFIRNTVEDRTFVVDSNDLEWIVSLSSTVQIQTDIEGLPTVPGMQDTTPWVENDTLTIFDVSSVITWTGRLGAQVPFGAVTFRSVVMRPQVEGDYMVAPPGAEHRVIFESSKLEVRSTSRPEPGYEGSYVMRAVYVEGKEANPIFTNNQPGRCLKMISVLVESSTTRLSGTCQALWFHTKNSPATAVNIADGTSFVGFGFHIENPTSSGAFLDRASSIFFEDLQIDKSTGAGQTLIINSHLQVYVLSSLIRCTDSCTIGVRLWRGSQSQLSNTAIEARQPVVMEHQSALSYWGSPKISGNFNGPVFNCKANTNLWFHFITSNSPPSVITQTVNQPIIACDGCTVGWNQSPSSFQWSTPSGTPLIRATYGARVLGNFGPTDLVNQGATSTDVIKCGDNAISAWTASENDLGAGSPQNCLCTRNAV